MKRSLAGLLILMGCQSGPPPRTYVLGAPVASVAGLSNETGRPVLDLRRVSLPDYLDTSDIQVRDGRNQLTPSATGRWGERLSVGITHALGEGLARRLPGVVVSWNGGASGQRLQVDVEAFDVSASGGCVLTARWTVRRDGQSTAGTVFRGTFVAQAANMADAAVVAAMGDAIEQLAAGIARSIGGTKKGGA